jgi:hypothetical protein
MRDRIVCGDTLDFVTTLPDYPAATYTLKYRLIPRASGTAIDITCSAGTEPNDHRCGAAAATTALWTAGEYSWASWVEKAGERYQVDAGAVTIVANPATASTYDSRSQAEVALDAVNAVLANRATLDQRRYSISGRELERMSPGELLELRSALQIDVMRERAARNRAKGLDDGRRIYLRAGRA